MLHFLLPMRSFCVLIVCICSFGFVSIPESAIAQKIENTETTVIAKAEVLQIIKQESHNIPGTDVQGSYQTIQVRILEGAEKGKIVTVENDYLSLKKDEVFYLMHTRSLFDDMDYYSVNDPYRLPQVLVLVVIFVVAVFIFGGKQGIRGLLSMLGSFVLIFYILLPGILQGYPPLLVTVTVSSLIIILGSYITHGFTRSTTAAVFGMVLTISVTGILAYWAVHFTKLSGFGSEEATYLNINAGGSIDILGLLLGGMIIGLLGVLYDAAIGQSVTVEELIRIAPRVSKKIIYERATRIGREHIGALVNTLAIAYVGASLPLLLLFTQSSSASIGKIANTEVFSTEIVRILIGSIGLVLAVPITTVVSVWFLHSRKKVDTTIETIEKEIHSLEHHTHSH